MKKLYLAWQDPSRRTWYPVGVLTLEGDSYHFKYTKGAKAASGFVPFPRMENLEAVYESKELFPLFANRLLSKSRPEYSDYLKWLALPEAEASSFVILSITEGLRETDSMEVFPCPEPNDAGKYEVRFLNHGLRHFPDYAVDRVARLNRGDKLYLMQDVQNEHDSYALALRTDDPRTVIGYCPKYLTNDLHALLRHNPTSVKVSVDQVNPDAPIQLRLVCRAESDWPPGFQSCSDDLYQPIRGNGAESFS
jgi:hypothetical protein